MEGGKSGTPNRDEGHCRTHRTRTTRKRGRVRPDAPWGRVIREQVLDTVWTRGISGSSRCRFKTRTPQIFLGCLLVVPRGIEPLFPP